MLKLFARSLCCEFIISWMGFIFDILRSTCMFSIHLHATSWIHMFVNSDLIGKMWKILFANSKTFTVYYSLTNWVTWPFKHLINHSILWHILQLNWNSSLNFWVQRIFCNDCNYKPSWSRLGINCHRVRKMCTMTQTRSLDPQNSILQLYQLSYLITWLHTHLFVKWSVPKHSHDI